MQFKFNQTLNMNVAQHQFKGRTIDVRLVVDTDQTQRLTRQAEQLIAHVDENWSAIEDAMVTALWQRYNEDWADEEDDCPELDRQQWLAKLVPQTIDYSGIELGQESVTMYFGDSGIYGGHGLEVYWAWHERPIRPSVSLVG
jgi:hypothetical protein